MNFFYKDKAALYVTQDVFKEAVAKKDGDKNTFSCN